MSNEVLADVSDSCITISKSKRETKGSCMMCNRNHTKVNVINGTTGVELRVCNKCLREINNYH